MRQVISSPTRIEGVAVAPGDKSISHRALLLNSIARGTAHVSNVCVGDDRTSMLRCLRGLGVHIVRHHDCYVCGAEECYTIDGKGPDGLSEPTTVLNSGNSGTTMRLVTGLLAAQHFLSIISGDHSLRQRPMDRIVRPLTQMGALVKGRSQDTFAPLAVHGGDLQGIDYEMPVASAQVKSCVLIAGLHADGETTVHQPAASRDHTFRLVQAMGGDIQVDGLSITVRRSTLRSMNVRVPGDTSGAAFWLVLGCCHPNARVRVEGVGINPYRTGVLDALKAMGGRISIENIREEGAEESADLIAESSELVGTEIGGDTIPRVIDELPALALAACFAKGKTVIRNAQELRVKESDRILATVDGLTRLGARVDEKPDGMVVHGGKRLTGAECQSFGDHRIAMTMGIAGLLARGITAVVGAEAANISYPDFWQILAKFESTKG